MGWGAFNKVFHLTVMTGTKIVVVWCSRITQYQNSFFHEIFNVIKIFVKWAPSHHSIQGNVNISPWLGDTYKLNYATIGSDNDLVPVRHQVIIWTNGGFLLTGSLEKKFSEIWIKIQQQRSIYWCHKINPLIKNKWWVANLLTLNLVCLMAVTQYEMT